MWEKRRKNHRPEQSTTTPWKHGALSLISAMIATLALVNVPAAAQVNDTFAIYTTNECGYIVFVDYGAGAPGGGNNDDYIRVNDLCGDHHGVRGYAWLNGKYPGSTYSGIRAPSSVVWDPFPRGEVSGGDFVGIKVCLVDGPNDSSPLFCASRSQTAIDG